MRASGPKRLFAKILFRDEQLSSNDTVACGTRHRAGDEKAMTAQQLAGWKNFQDLHCAACHVPPLISDNGFFNIGLRPRLASEAEAQQGPEIG